MASVCADCGKAATWTQPLYDGTRCAPCWKAHEDELKGLRDAEHATAAAEAAEIQAEIDAIILTTESAPNLPIAERLDIVTAEVVIGMHLFRDIASTLRDTFGGRSGTMQKGLREARQTALAELRGEAYAVGADAVIAVDLDYSEISGGGKSMLFLVASGTAVRLGKLTS